MIDKAYEIAKGNGSQLLVEITEKRNEIYEQMSHISVSAHAGKVDGTDTHDNGEDT